MKTTLNFLQSQLDENAILTESECLTVQGGDDKRRDRPGQTQTASQRSVVYVVTRVSNGNLRLFAYYR